MELTFDLGTISVMLIIITTLISGAVWVVSLFSRVSVRIVNQERDLVSLKASVLKIDNRTLAEQKENEAFRHKYKTTVESLYLLIESKFTDFDKHFMDFKDLIQTKIDLAISKNNEKK